MILAVFGTVYAICLAILALTFLNAKPLGPTRAATSDGTREDGHDAPRAVPDVRREFATHH